MDPVRALLYMSKLSRADKTPRFSGKGPVKEFTDKERKAIAGQCGMVLSMRPVSRLFDTSKNINWVSWDKDNGRVDSKELKDSTISTRDSAKPRDPGTTPVKFALDKSRVTREVKLPNTSGIVPPICPPTVAWDKLRPLITDPLQLTPTHSHTFDTG